MQDFRKLKVWRKAHELTLNIYKATKNFPKEETYGLTSQIRRASASIPANISEGCGRMGQVELNRFLQIAFSSANELEYHLILASDLKYLKNETTQELSDLLLEIKQMLAGLIRRIRSHQKTDN